MRAALGICPLLFLVVHCLVSGYVLTGALLAVVPIAVLSANSFSSVIHCATPVSASTCVAAKSDHLLVNTSMDFSKS